MKFQNWLSIKTSNLSFLWKKSFYSIKDLSKLANWYVFRKGTNFVVFK